MKNDGQFLYISVESLRNRVTSQLIPLFFFATLIGILISLVRIPAIGFRPFMILHLFIIAASSILYAGRKRILPGHSALVIIGMLSLFIISGVASLGLLSVTFVLGPTIALYLMLMGHRKSAYISIWINFVFLSIMGYLFVYGAFETAVSPEVYIRSVPAWALMIIAVSGVSFGIVAPLELIPGTLQRSEERFLHAFENANVGMCLTSLEGRFLKVNHALCEMLGYSREELEELHFSDVTFADDRAMSLDSIKQGQSGGAGKVNIEKRYVHKRGNVLWANVSSSLICDAQGLPQHFITHVHDITERKLAEAGLIESETKFRSIFENVQDVYFETTLEGVVLEISPSIEILSRGQYSRSDLLAKSFVDFYYDPTVRVTLLGLLRERQQLSDFELILKNRDGAAVECSISAKLQHSPQNNSTIISGTIRDISERKEAERLVRESQSRFRELWEATVEGIAIHDKGTILEVNDAMCRLFGIKREQAVGKLLYDFAPPEMRDRLFQHANSDAEGRFESSAIKQDGSRLILEIFGKHILYHGKIVRMAAVRDITERKRTEDALRESEERYQRITEAITDYIYTVRVADGRVIETKHGPGCVNVTGYHPNEFAENPFLWFNMVLAEDRPKVEEQARQILQGKVPPPIEHRIHRKDGTVRWMRNTFVLHHDENGALDAYDGLIQDITKRKRAEEALQESESKYRELVEGSPDAIAIYANAKVVFVNSASVEIMRASRKEDLIGMPAIEFVHPDYRGMVAARMKESATSGKGLPLLEEKFVRLDGTDVDVEVRTLKVTYRGQPGVQLIIRDITEKKTAQQALRESELRYRATVEQSNEGITIADLDGRYIMVNPAFCRMTGFAQEELLTMRVGDLMARKNSLKLFPYVAKEHQSGYREAELVRKDGTTFFAVITASSLEIGNAQFVQGIVQDITEHKRAEEALRESEERFHHMFEMHDAVMLLIEPVSGRIKDANPAAEKFYGYSVEQLRGMSIQNINAASEGTIAEESRHAFSSEKKYFIFLHRLANGETRTVEVHSSPVMMEGTRILFSIIHDITERQHAEDELRKLSLAVEQSPASIVITDTQGNIEYVNPKFTEVSGYSMEEARGMKPSILKSGETTPDEYRRLWETITAGHDWQGEFHNKKKNGELFWETASISPVKNKDNVVTNFVAVKEDITDRKRSEEALRHAQKLESIGTLAGGIAHDFNNLLNVIMGQSSLAMGRLPRESPAGNNITKALKAAERAADLTRQLLAYSGKGKFVTEDFNLNRLVDENAQFLELSVPKTTQLRYELDSACLFIHGDVGQVQQVIMNLIINAGEAMGANPGYITIRTRRTDITESNTEFWKYTNNPLPAGVYASLQVSDTGHGMRPEILARIFDPFFTTKFTGRGLGLAAVLGIVRGHHGGVRIESTKGKGTLFEIVFPIVQSPTVPGVQGTKNASLIDGSGRTILVIDDEPSILELLTDVLTEAKFTVLSAMNPIEGIELYRRRQRDIAMVILDYSMPGMDGRVAFEELRKISKSIPVLLCSGYTEEEMKSAFGDIRPNSFIKKPYRPIELLERVASIIPAKGS